MNTDTTTAVQGPPKGAAADEFYVGYLPTPPRHRRTLRLVVPALLGAMALGAGLFSWAQRDPGPSAWSETLSEVEGVLLDTPYPMIVNVDSGGTVTGVVLLVEEGKHGVHRSDALVGKRVRARGLRLEREGRTLLELAPSADAIVALPISEGGRDAGAARVSAPMVAGNVSLRGEIVDSKCFHGAMKPGDGKGHKACATLCVRNGIPAMFAVRDGPAIGDLCLVTGPDGRALEESVLAFVGEPVEVNGELSIMGPVKILRLARDGVKRIAR